MDRDTSGMRRDVSGMWCGGMDSGLDRGTTGMTRDVSGMDRSIVCGGMDSGAWIAACPACIVKRAVWIGA